MEADVKEVAFVELEGCRPIAECNRGYVSEGTYQGKKVAIKHITLSNDWDVEHTSHEIKNLGSLKHVNIINMIGYCFKSDNEVCIITDIVTGTDLERFLKDYRPSEKLQIRILLHIAKAFAHIHRNGIMHRDLKPSNILLDRSHQAIICDFGLSKRIDPLEDQHSALAGTIQYMAPEVIQGGGYDTKVDVFSFGLVIYEVLTGKQLPRRSLTEPRRLGIPPDPPGDESPVLWDVLYHCIHCIAKARPTFAELEVVLQGLYEEHTGAIEATRIRL